MSRSKFLLASKLPWIKSKTFFYDNLVTLLLLLAAAVIRYMLYFDFPIFLTNDSWEYITTSKEICERLSFLVPGLDWRMPMYPLFLALIRSIFQFDSFGVVFLQKMIGIGCVLLGYCIGRLLDSPRISRFLIIFLGFNPIYLLNEHLVMPEGLFLFTLLWFSVMIIICLRVKFNFVIGLVLGLSLGVCVLTRSNGLFFCAPLLAAMIGVQWIHQKAFPFIRDRQQKIILFIIGVIIGCTLLFGPWIYRNYVRWGRVSLFNNNTYVNMLVYLAQHNLLDTSLSKLNTLGPLYNSDSPDSIYKIVWVLRKDLDAGNNEAKSIVYEQILNQPSRYAQEVTYSLLHFGGYRVPNVVYGRNDVYWWFENLVNDVQSVHDFNSRWYTDADRTSSLAINGDSWLTRLWRKFGMVYLESIRALLSTVFLVSCAGYIVLHKGVRFDMRSMVVILCAISYLFVVLLHAFVLADYDRFSTPFDWLLLLVIGLVVDKIANDLFHQNEGALE